MTTELNTPLVVAASLIDIAALLYIGIVVGGAQWGCVALSINDNPGHA